MAARLVRQAIAALRGAEEGDEQNEYGALLWQAAADGIESLSLGLHLIGSHDPAEREAGCDLLGHASNQHGAVRAETATALVALAQRETEVCVLASVARAIEMTYDPRAVPVLVALAEHPDAEVRQAVAASFTGVLTGSPDGPDVRALIMLTRDRHPRVRDWATFTLGFQAEVDGPAIRAALWERTGDEDPDARREGVHGLARRHDPRAVPLLAGLLNDPDGAHDQTFQAAQIMGDPRLLAPLLQYEPRDAGVAAAVHACDPAFRARLDDHARSLVCALHRMRPDLDAALYVERLDSVLLLGFDAALGPSRFDVQALLERAGHDPARAAELVATDLPRNPQTTAEVR